MIRRFKTKSNFLTVLGAGNITKDDVCLIKDTQEVYSDGTWYGRVDSGAMTFKGHWESADTPYLKNSVVKFNDHLFIALVDTSSAPYPVLKDKSGRLQRYGNNGGYILASKTMNEDWFMLM